METRQVIQASANIIRITNLSKGDVYKRIEESSYSEPGVKYGIVMDLLNDGNECFIEVLEYTKSYSTVSCSIKVFSGKKDVAIFPATPEEVKEYLQSSVDSMERDIEEKKKEVEKKIEECKKAKEFVSGETMKKLTATKFESLDFGSLPIPVIA